MPVKKPRRFEFREGSSDKFWEVSTAGAELTTKWGKNGTDGQVTTKTLSTGGVAEAEAYKLVRTKVEEGYAEIGSPPKPRQGRPIDPKVAAAVQFAWKRIEKWLAENAPPLAGRLGKPATLGTIFRTEKALGVELPDDVRASYMVHNGTGDMNLFPSADYLSLEGMVFQYKSWKQLVEEGTFGDEVSSPEGPIRTVHYHLRWIPVSHNGGGDHTLIDLAPAKGGKVGQLIDFSHETGPERVAARSMTEYLSGVAAVLEAGVAWFYNYPHVDDDRPKTPRVWQWVKWPEGRRLVKPAGRKKRTAVDPDLFPVKRYFECISGSSRKFWEVFQGDKQVITNWGRIGSEGKPKLKRHRSPNEAAAAVEAAVAKKLAEGYVEKP